LKTRFTISQLEQLQKDGKIKGFAVQQSAENYDNTPAKNMSKQKTDRGSKQKKYISEQLGWWCKDKGYNLVPEHRFHEFRKFRFDWAIKEVMIAIEYEGLFSEKSGHTTIGGYNKDVDKYNLAAECGWTVIRFTAMNYKTVIEVLEKTIPQI
jgi:very-short-patch-repair endonuclease